MIWFAGAIKKHSVQLDVVQFGFVILSELNNAKGLLKRRVSESIVFLARNI